MKYMNHMLEKEMEKVFNNKVEEKFINLKTVKQSENDDIERKRHFVDLERAELFSMRAQFEREKLALETKSQLKHLKMSLLIFPNTYLAHNNS